jgi:excisionase family DNA binding protein
MDTRIEVNPEENPKVAILSDLEGILVGTGQAARILGRHRTTVAGWARQGKLAFAAREGRQSRYRFRLSDILKYRGNGRA